MKPRWLLTGLCGAGYPACSRLSAGSSVDVHSGRAGWKAGCSQNWLPHKEAQ
jgi:hypothetical protein